MTTPTTRPALLPLLLEDRQGLEVISYDECKTLLRKTPVGRVGFVHNNATVLLPVNAVFVSGAVMFRTAPGSKLDNAVFGKPMSFEIDDWDNDLRTGWSVLVKGVTDTVNDEWLDRLYAVIQAEPWADQVPRTNWVRIRADEISGRRIVRDLGAPVPSPS